MFSGRSGAGCDNVRDAVAIDVEGQGTVVEPSFLFLRDDLNATSKESDREAHTGQITHPMPTSVERNNSNAWSKSEQHKRYNTGI